MQPGAVRHPGVHPGPGVVQAPARDGSQPLGEPAHGIGVGERHPGQLQPAAAVHPHPVRGGHQDIGDLRVGEQRLQRAGPDQFGP